MTPFIADDDFTLHVGNVLDVLRELPAESVDCIVTSPPYWGLRDYGTGDSQVWGGDQAHAHEWGDEIMVGGGAGNKQTTDALQWQGAHGQGASAQFNPDKPGYRSAGSFCACGAWRGQLGLEPTPQLFVEHMREIFREARRVLARHGTFWLNLGDSYIGGGRGGKDGTQAGSISKSHADAGVVWGAATGKIEGLKSKDLAMIPARVALALQDDGWWLRAECIWSKPNPMPESVTDRPTKSHETVYLFTKQGTPDFWVHPFTRQSVDKKPEPDYYWFPPRGQYGSPGSDLMLVEQQREHFTSLGWERRNVWIGHDYYYDQEPTREQYAAASEDRYKYAFGGPAKEAVGEFGRTRPEGMREWQGETVEPAPTLGDLPPEAERGPDGRRNTHVEAGENSIQHRDGERWANSGRNMRTVWEITVQPYRDAHFATFPQELPRRCIVSGCPEWVCRTCGKPRVRLFGVEYDEDALKGTGWDSTYDKPAEDVDHQRSVSEMYRESLTKRRVFLGWSDCGHDNYRRGIVMDPFMGSGTTAKVARDNGRHAVGIELNEKYAALIMERTRQLSLIT